MPRRPVHVLLAEAAYAGREVTEDELAAFQLAPEHRALVARAPARPPSYTQGASEAAPTSTPASEPTRSSRCCPRPSATPATCTSPNSSTTSAPPRWPREYPANARREPTCPTSSAPGARPPTTNAAPDPEHPSPATHDRRHTAFTHEAAAGNPQAYVQLKAARKARSPSSTSTPSRGSGGRSSPRRRANVRRR